MQMNDSKTLGNPAKRPNKPFRKYWSLTSFPVKKPSLAMGQNPWGPQVAVGSIFPLTNGFFWGTRYFDPNAIMEHDGKR